MSREHHRRYDAALERRRATPTSSETAPQWLQLVRRFSGPTFVIAGFSATSTYFWWGMALAYFGLVLLIVEVVYEPWLLRQNPAYQIACLGVIFFLSDLITIRIVLSPAPLDVQATSSVPSYGPGSNIHGIEWSSNLANFDLVVSNPSPTDYEHFDALVTTDIVIKTLRQIHGFSDCQTLGAHPTVDNPVSQYMVGGQPVGPATNSKYQVVPLDKNGHPVNVPISGGADWTYRIICDRIPAHSQSEFFGAVEVINEPDLSSKAKALASSATPLFGAPRAAKWVLLEARFQTTLGRNRSITRQVQIAAP